MTKKLLILCQIGSPEAPTPKAVGRYLQKFLMDEKVITLPKWIRWLLVHLVIIPGRKISSAKKYHKIWTPHGAPLKHETEKFTEKLKQELGSTFDVALVFAYGQQTPEQILRPLQKNNYAEILIAPLFPQYAEATTGSVLQTLLPVVQKMFSQAEVKTLKPFYSQPEWAQAWTKKIRALPEDQGHVLFSYHGLPESQIRQVSGCELSDQCCARPEISKCYLAQCRKSTELIVRELNLSNSSLNFSMSFQSRLGRAKWLGPSTESEAIRLAQNGQKSLTVVCPAFVADGLETLEEIGIDLREKFFQAGGEKFALVLSLNDDSQWVSGFAEVLRRAKSWHQVDFTSP